MRLKNLVHQRYCLPYAEEKENLLPTDATTELRPNKVAQRLGLSFTEHEDAGQNPAAAV